MPSPASEQPLAALPVKLLALHKQRLRQILGALIAAFALFVFLNLAKGRVLHAVPHLLLSVLLAVAYWLNMRDRTHLAVRWMMTTLLLGLIGVSAGDQGLFDEAAMAYPGLLVFAGMFGSKRLLAGLTAVMLVAMAVLYGLDRSGVLASLPSPLDISRPIGMGLIVLVSAMFVWMLANDLRTTVAQLDEEKQALQASNARIQELVQTDTLTGLPNRRYGLERLERILSGIRQGRDPAAVVFLDLDDFKTINDSLGHAAGDDLLRQVAQRLVDNVRATDTVARISGDEFLILLVDLPDEEAIGAHVARLMRALEAPFTLTGMDVVATASLGVAVAPRDGARAVELLKNADLAMYRAKDSGRNTCRFFNADMNASVVEQLRIAACLRTALSSRELELHYQPQFDLRSGQVVGAEALLRWNHPELGRVPPSKFIPVAERSGQIVELGAWVLAKATADAQAWRDAGLGDLTVAVNVSPLQLQRGDIDLGIRRALAASGLPAHLLELELTESLLMADDRHLQAAVQRVSETGARLAIDDFGTGYSNLGYLRRFAVHRLKIDQSFVQKVCAGHRDEGLVRAIVEMAHCLELTVVGEGIEDADTLQRLGAIGCEFGQGYHWSPALPMADFVAYVRGHSAQIG